MTAAPQILLQHHLKKLRLPTFQGEYAKQAQICAAESETLSAIGPRTMVERPHPISGAAL